MLANPPDSGALRKCPFKQRKGIHGKPSGARHHGLNRGEQFFEFLLEKPVIIRAQRIPGDPTLARLRLFRT